MDAVVSGFSRTVEQYNIRVVAASAIRDVFYLHAAWNARNAVIRVDLDGGPLDGCGAVGGMEELAFYSAGSKSFPTWQVRGTDGPDQLQLYDHGRLVARLGAGDDYVSSGDGDDLLWGGAGTDYAYASGGDDTCRGFELAERCEDDERSLLSP